MADKKEFLMFSVIVPVYNVARYLTKCLNSICDQTYSNFEIICVDDGSTDESSVMLDAYAKRDQRIRVIHQKNTGLGGARNTALKQVRGKYIIFVDSDDWIKGPDVFKKLAKSIEKNHPDLVLFGSDIVDAETELFRYTSVRKEWPQKEWGWSGLKAKTMPYLLRCNNASAWGKVFLTRAVQKYHLTFGTRVRFGEDVIFSLPMILKAKKILFINQSFYMYRLNRAGSLTCVEQTHTDDLFDSVQDIQKKYTLNTMQFYYLYQWLCKDLVWYFEQHVPTYTLFKKIRKLVCFLSQPVHIHQMRQSVYFARLAAYAECPYLYVGYYNRPHVWKRLSWPKKLGIYLCLMPFFIKCLHNQAKENQ